MVRHSTAHAVRAVALLASIALAACDSATSPGATATVRIASPAVTGLSSAVGEGLSITGTNGTLLITDIKLVVDEFELRRAEVADCEDSSGSGQCGEFEAQAFLADVPLGSGSVTVANDRIPPGTYTGLEFEVKDLEVGVGDAHDSLQAGHIAALLAQARLTHPDWPAGASLMIEGTFTPTGGAAQPFRVYFNAEVEIETLFESPLVIDAASQGVTIDLRPDLWFKNEDGSVRNLALLDFATIHALVEFEVEFEGGVDVELEHD